MAAAVIFSGHAGSFLAPFQGPEWSQGPLRDHSMHRCVAYSANFSAADFASSLFAYRLPGLSQPSGGGACAPISHGQTFRHVRIAESPMGHGRKRLQSSPILRILRGAVSSVGGSGSEDTLSRSLDPLAVLDQDKGSFRVASDQMVPRGPPQKR